MAQFNAGNTYAVGDRVSYDDLYYECIVDNPDNTSTPNEGLYWNEAFIQLSDIITKAYVTGISTSVQMFNTTKEIKIFGYYFDSTVEVNIPNCTVTIVNIEPGEITLSVDAGSTIGINPVSIAKAGVQNDGISVSLEIVNQITGNGSAGTFDTVFSNNSGDLLWVDWSLEIFGNVNGIDTYFVSSNAGTPSGNTGPNASDDGTYYAFSETSNPNNGNGQYGTATTDNFRAISSIDFDYHMFGAGIGDLTIEGYDGGAWITLYTLSGQQQTAQGDAWLHASIPCSDLSAVRFMFNYPTFSTAYTADISLDNISIVST